jgi:hypothetical protein
VLWSADFTGQTAGAGSSSFQGVSLSRSGTNATVQTSATTISAALAANLWRFYADGTNTGAVIEESRANLLSSPRSPQTIAPWSAGTAAGTGNYIAGPDGTSVAYRANPASAQLTNYQSVTVTAGTYAGSIWQRYSQGAGTGDVQAVLNDNGSVTTPLVGAAVGQAWARYSGSIVVAGTTLLFITQDGRNQSGSGGQGAAAHDAAVDLSQVEAGKFATSFVVGTRNVEIASTATDLRNAAGSLKLETFVKPLGASSAYASDQQQWWIDANNGVKVVQSTRKVTVTLGGVSVVLPVAIPAFSAMDSVRLYTECGGGIAAHGWVSINGTVTDLGSQTLAGNVPSGTVYLLNNSTANVWSSLIQRIVAYP